MKLAQEGAPTAFSTHVSKIKPKILIPHLCNLCMNFLISSLRRRMLATVLGYGKMFNIIISTN